MPTEEITLLEPRLQEGFVETASIQDIVERAMAYVEAGFPVHLRGPTGTGKTTLAMHLAYLIGRPVVMLHGDEELGTSGLVGGEHGYRIRKTLDNYIHSVRKFEEDATKRWVDSRLTVACRHGFTLIYDEFTRSRPEANNVLLSILQEKMLDLPAARQGDNYLRVHPDFTAIFTSNPEEYAGTHKAADALRDRMITLDLGHLDRDTEIGVTAAKGEIEAEDAARLVDVVRGFRENGKYDFAPTVRAPIMMARVLKVRGAVVRADDEIFRQTCIDVLTSETSRLGVRADGQHAQRLIERLVDEHCQPDGTPTPRSRKGGKLLSRFLPRRSGQQPAPELAADMCAQSAGEEELQADRAT